MAEESIVVLTKEEWEQLQERNRQAGIWVPGYVGVYVEWSEEESKDDK